MTECINFNEYPGGVLAVDSGMIRDRMTACYLLEAGTEVAIIETGGTSGVLRLLDVLGQRGWSREDVRYVIVTHVHLDHAGGAGALMKALPNASLVVHPRGARHMIDPSRLEASARRVYGDEEFEKMYGSLPAVPAERVREMADGDRLTIGERELVFIDTPGHARHHFCVWDEETRGWFTGDTFGLSYREFDTEKGAFVFPTTTPIEFDPEVLKQSIERLMSRDPACMYLTHYGRVTDIQRLAAEMLVGVDRLVEIALLHDGKADRDALISGDIRDWLLAALNDHGVRLAPDRIDRLLRMDIDLNAAGIGFWLDRVRKAGVEGG